jgi:hypothetical protein
MNEGRKLENEYLLKQMLWDKQNIQTQFKPTFQQYKKSIEDYDDVQNNVQVNVNVAGEPVKYTDSYGVTFMNTMRKIDENFDEIENKLSVNRQQSAVVSGNSKINENFQSNDDGSDFDINDVENEIMRNFSGSFNNRNALTTVNVSNSIGNQMNSNKNQSKCLNETESTSTTMSTASISNDLF